MATVPADTTAVEDLLALAEQREASMRKAFNRYDENHNGSIDSDELALLLVDLGFDDTICEAEFDKADKDGSKTITFDEFCVYYNTLLDRITAATRNVRLLARKKSREHKGRFRRPSTDSVGSSGSASSRPTPRGRQHTTAARPPRQTRRGGGSRGLALRDGAPARGPRRRAAGAPTLKIEQAGAVSSRSRQQQQPAVAAAPPRPELLRFDSISDEIAAYERGDIAAPAEAAVDNRVACATCGRKFFPTSIERHERICRKATANAKRRGKFKVKRVR